MIRKLIYFILLFHFKFIKLLYLCIYMYISFSIKYICIDDEVGIRSNFRMKMFLKLKLNAKSKMVYDQLISSIYLILIIFIIQINVNHLWTKPLFIFSHILYREYMPFGILNERGVY